LLELPDRLPFAICLIRSPALPDGFFDARSIAAGNTARSALATHMGHGCQKKHCGKYHTASMFAAYIIEDHNVRKQLVNRRVPGHDHRVARNLEQGGISWSLKAVVTKVAPNISSLTGWA
jgi:hypothetical protein